MKKRYYAYLIYLIMITLIVTAVAFSRYGTTVSSSGEATVARPVLCYVPNSATLNGNTIIDISSGIMAAGILPGDVLVYHFGIQNFEGVNLNQVLLQYKITVTFNPSTKNLPLTYTLQPAGSYLSADGGWTYMGFGAQTTHSYTLTISWDEADDDATYINQQQDIQIKIDSEQADSFR